MMADGYLKILGFDAPEKISSGLRAQTLNYLLFTKLKKGQK